MATWFNDFGRFVKKYTITSSAITTSAVSFTDTVQGDSLIVEQIIVRTDSTGLAGGTNFVISQSSGKGLANVFVETVANLGANKTVTAGSVTNIPTILDIGSTLKVNNTVAVGTGAGTIDIFVYFRKLSSVSVI